MMRPKHESVEGDAQPIPLQLLLSSQPGHSCSWRMTQQISKVQACNQMERVYREHHACKKSTSPFVAHSLKLAPAPVRIFRDLHTNCWPSADLGPPRSC